MGRRSYAGGANTVTLANPVSAGDGSLLAGVTPLGWPDGSGGPFAIVVNKGFASEEKMLVSARTGSALAISQRGYDGTTAQSHSNPESIQLCVTAIDLDEANAHVNASLGVHGLASIDRVAGVDAVQTLTHKTIDGVTNTLQNIPRLASPQIDSKLTSLDADNAAQDAITATKVAKAGDTMTGLLLLSGTPVADLGAANKKYVDDGFTAAALATSNALALKLALAGGTMTGALTLAADAAAALQPTSKQQVDAQIAALHPSLVWSTPTLGLHITDYDASTYFGPRYFKDAFGVVRLRGLGKTTAFVNNGDTLLTLPAGCRPGIRLVFAATMSGTLITGVPSATTVGVALRLDILPDGTVICPQDDFAISTWFSLAGISFIAEN